MNNPLFMRDLIKLVAGMFCAGLLTFIPVSAQEDSGAEYKIINLSEGITAEEFIENNGLSADQVQIGRTGTLRIKTSQPDGMNRKRTWSGAENVSDDFGPELCDTYPNDSLYSTQWNMNKIGMEQVWDEYQGSNEVLVAVIDTGFNVNHEDLQGVVWTNNDEIPNNNIDDDYNGYVDDYHGYDFYGNTDDIYDGYGHGTPVGSIIVSNTNNSIGLAGINWQTKIMPLKMYDSQANGSYFSLAEAIYYAVDNGAQIISMSVGGNYNSPDVSLAVSYAANHGVLMIASSGNATNDIDAQNVYYPAKYPQVVSVGASTINDEVATASSTGYWYSHYDENLDLIAPGVNHPAASADGGYRYFGGTSGACPHVSGAAAILLGYENSLTPDQIRSYLDNNAQHVAGMDTAEAIRYGNGRLDVLAAFNQVKQDYGHVQIINHNIDGVHESENLYHAIGQVIDDSDASNLQATQATIQDGPGHVQYGPYVGYEASNELYVAKFRLKTSDNTIEGNVAQLEVFNTEYPGESKKIYVRGTDFDQANTYQEFYIKFRKDALGLLEYRVFSYAISDITVDSVDVVETSSDGSERYESEDMYRNAGTVIFDNLASEKLAVQVKSNETGFAQYGPYVTNLTSDYKYRANFRMWTTDNSTADEIVQIEVINHTHPELNQIRRIRAVDFAKANSQENFGLDFTVRDYDLLEYRVLNLGNSHNIDITIDCVQINYDDNFWSRNYEAEDMYSHVGSVVSESAYSNQKARQATVNSDSAGFLVYGPYANNLDDNKNYYAKFRLKTNNNYTSQNIARIEISNPGGSAPYVGRDITGHMFAQSDTWQDFTLHFNRGTGGTLEYRVYFYDNQGNILVDNIQIIDKNDEHVTYEAEDMYIGQGQVGRDSYNQVVYVKSYAGNEGHIVYGPYTYDQTPGQYQATFKIKNEGYADGPLARIDAVNVDGNGAYVSRELYYSDFSFGGFDEHTLDFVRTDNGNMEYRVYTYGQTNISVDSVTIDKTGDVEASVY